MIIAAPLVLPGLQHAFFTREGGVSEGIYASLNGGVGSNDSPEAVRENRAIMASHFGVVPDRLVTVWQVHSPDCLAVDRPWPGERPKADGLATATPGLVLGIATADCGPVLFADAERRVIGACHAGWKGAFTGVVEATVNRMVELGAKREAIVAVLGPCIGPDAYEVGPEFVARFAEQANENAQFFKPSAREGHAYFDLHRYIGSRAAGAGIASFTDLGLCTYADEMRFYSYRRMVHRGEGDYGRLISAIMISE